MRAAGIGIECTVTAARPFNYARLIIRRPRARACVISISMRRRDAAALVAGARRRPLSGCDGGRRFVSAGGVAFLS